MSHETHSRLVFYVPRVPPLHPLSFPSSLHIDGISDQRFAMIREQLTILPNCQGVIVNSFEELEKDACQARRAPLSSLLCWPTHSVWFLRRWRCKIRYERGSELRRKLSASSGLMDRRNNLSCMSPLAACSIPLLKTLKALPRESGKANNPFFGS
ncbi:hypothetical protein L7F22_051960 [Adiantum nelumboides]|nr:hypothetical protein [Adiantum nelumboides]